MCEWLQSCEVYSLWHCKVQFQEVSCHKFCGVYCDSSMLEIRNCHVVDNTLLLKKPQPAWDDATITAVYSFTSYAFRSAA